MHRLPISPERIAPLVRLTPDERHYLLDVLRLNADDALEVFDGLGGRFPAKIVLPASPSDEAALALEARLPDEEDAAGTGCAVSLAPALIKNDRLDWAIEKATELGAARILPWEGMNSVVRLDPKRGAQRQERWQKIAAAAARQCGRAFIPTVSAPGKLADVVKEAIEVRSEVCIVLYERETEHLLSGVIAAELTSTGRRAVCLVTGPEGGFREEEIARCRELGAITASLGRRILRAETAPIAALAAIRALCGEM